MYKRQLPAGQNLGELKDVEYFKKKLYNSLNLPPSRLTDDNKGFNLGKTTEVLRDELKFTKFIGRLRKRFGELFHDILKTQLILKGVISPEDWDEMKEHIQYDFLFDNHFNELKEKELMTQRIALATQMDVFVGKYYSIEYIRKHILEQSEKEYKEIDKQMQKEIDQGLAMDPIDVTQLDQMDRMNTQRMLQKSSHSKQITKQHLTKQLRMMLIKSNFKWQNLNLHLQVILNN